ncbi:gliding motility-associated C-terminal domain-containing protein [Catalinimonas sp. 4WD22]|uniref:T9SS type B sorting domain-containing protein n=1 Tax=Catalinimonas locisalis TaxID=3133978 RepID=UPI003100E73D
MKHLYKYLSIIFFLFSFTAQAQVEEICGDEIDNDGNGLIDCADLAAQCYLVDPNCAIESDCGNGIDDDGDGFVDYYDGDCLDDPDNPNDYITIKPDCEAQPVGNVFEIEPAWDSGNQTSAALGMPSVADLDQDGYPEVISMNSETGWLYIIDGRTGNTLNQVRVKNGGVFAYPAVGDVDGDGFGEIFTIDLNGVIRVYEHDLTLKWSATSTFTGFGRPLALADFNQDGKAELYSVNEVWDAETGTLLIKGSHGSSMYASANNWYTELNAVPVAIDIIPSSPGLELVVGHIIYTVNITNSGGTAGNSLSEAMNMDDAGNKPAGYAGYHPADADWGNQNYSQTAVVDYNLDGNLDVIMGGANGGHDGPTTAFFWDIANDEVKTFTILRPGNTIPGSIRATFEDENGNNCDNGDLCYWERGLGNINIADIDNDGQLEATFMSGSSLYAIETDFTEKWANHDDFWESSSGVTGTTVFDFDGDGSSEIVYRDEINLYIVDGTTGTPLNLLTNTFCSSQTQGDYPIVADVDGDGETEIIVSCGEAENIFGTAPGATSGTRTNGFIRAYKAAGGNYWVPSRALWNQTNYFNVNINDNLTIPRYQQAHHLNFAQICNDPSAPVFALNKFLNQSPRISYCGQLTFPSPKLDFADDGVVITPPVCPDDQFEVRVVFQNNGDQAISKPVPISFYAENPTNSFSNTDESPYLETVEIDVPGGIDIDEKIDTTFTVNAIRGAFTLFVSLNDIGQKDSTGAPMTNETFYPLTKLNGTIRECDDTPTIISKAVNPLPFDLKAVKLRDNRNCPGEVAFNNGEVQVLAPDDTPFPASDYSFTWTNISTGQVISNDALVTGLDSGTYRVVVEYTAVGCVGNADTVRVEKFEDWPDTQVITLEELQPVSSCTPGTADGIARVLINGSAVDETQYEIEWEDEQQAGVLAIGDTATNLKPILYKVTVTNKLTGCSDSETIDMTLDLPVMKVPTVTANQNCKNPNGSITAKVEGSKSDYEYILIQHSPIQDTLTVHNNGAFTGLAAGIYELRAFDPATECGKYSNGIEIELIDQKAIDDLTIEIASPQTACEAPYNGQLRAMVDDESKYDFVWYLGTVTTGPSAVVVGNAATTPDTLSTNLTNGIYTVVVTHKTTGCIASADTTLTETIVKPVVATTNIDIIKHQTECNPDGEVQFSVGTSNETNGYIFHLMKGSDTLSTNETGLFTGLEEGRYSVEVQNKITKCSADNTPSFDILDQIPAFGPVNIDYSHLTSCNPLSPDGGASLEVKGTTSGYTFYWYEGTDTTTPLSPQPTTSYQLIDAPADDYTVYITHPSTGCDTLVNLRIQDQTELYQDSIEIVSVTPQNNCDPKPKIGSITAGLIKSVNGDPPMISDYTFTWYRGSKDDVINNAATEIIGETGPTIDGLDAGTYAVTAQRKDGCDVLNVIDATVEDLRNFPKPDIQVKIVEQSSCDSDNPNGRLEANVGNLTAGFTFNWYRNNNGIPDPVAMNTPIADNLPTGNYILEVIRDATNCSMDTTITLEDNIAVGSEIELIVNSSPVTGCEPNNGEMEVTDVIVKGTSTSGQADYTYDWYRIIEPGVDSVLVASNTGPTLSGMSEGDYSVVATNDTTSCNSIAWPVTITRDPSLDITFSFNAKNQDSCVPPDGALEVQFPGGEDINDFTYQWYLGQDTTYYKIEGETSHILDEVRAEFYTVAVTSKSTGCTTINYWEIPPGADLLPIPGPTPTIVASSSCDPYNGTISVEVDPGVLSSGDYAANSYTQDDFYFYWFEGTRILREDVHPEFDHPDNYKPLFEPTAADNRNMITGLKPGEYTVIIVDVKNGVDNPGCRSTAKHTFVVPADAFKPNVISVSAKDNIMCGPTGDGFVSVEVDKKAGDITTNSGFDFYWFNSDVVGLSTAADYTSTDVAAPFESTYNNITGGEYTVLIVDKETGCDTTIFRKIYDKAVPPEIQGTSVVAQRDCAAQFGSIEVTTLSNGYALSDHDFYWYDSEANLTADLPYKVGNTGTPSDWESTGLATGYYWIVAKSKLTNCISIPEKVFVPDNRHYPVVQLDTKEPYTRCDGIGDGSITVSLSDTPNPGAAKFDITWTSSVPGFTTVVENGVTTSTLSNLLPGRYDFEVINNDTGCPYRGYYEVETEPINPVLLANAFDLKHVKTCQNDGAITITEVEFDGVDTGTSGTDFTFEWRYGSNDAAGATAFNDLVTPGGVVISPTGHSITNLPEGDYYVWVTHAYGCRSVRSKHFEISDNSTPPIIKKNFIDTDILCDGVFDGEIEVRGEEDGPELPTNGYTFTWYDSNGIQFFQEDQPEVSIQTGLEAGTYTIEILNKDTQCSSNRSFEVKGEYRLPVLYVTKIADQSYCYGNGEAEINSIVDRDGNELSLNNFTYHWYESDQVTEIITSQYGLNADKISADSLFAGTYFVIAEDNVSNCRTYPVQVTIEDTSEPLIVVLDDISDPILACDPSNFPEGEIEINVRNSNTVISSWYAGSTITNLADSIAGFNNSLEIENLVPGQYTIWVQDTLSGCSTTRTYTIEGIEVPITLSTSSSNFSSCIQPDGKVAANINGGSGDYIITWYSGSGTDLQQLPFANDNTLIEGLTNGTYTVVVQDRIEPYCQESKAEIVIEDSRGEEIMVTINNDFQMTNCDDSLPNGQLSASVNGELSRYNFFWYNGTDTNSKPIATGPVIAELLPGEYTLLARDKITGCISRPFTGEVIAAPDTTIVPAPFVSSTPVTRCDTPNGTATAVMDSTFIEPDVDYEYNWFDADGELVFSSSRTNTANFLSAGEYSVTVTNVLTGCSSQSTTVTVGEEIYVPEFEVFSTPSICSQPNGTIRLEFVEPIKIVDVEWITPDGFASGFILNNQPAGFYEVTITDEKGCKHTKTAEIKSEIHVYNGVSPNGDGKNDKFLISCIEQYHENVVRIYNRAGAIVYEDFNYDNERIYFEGYGNRGLYIGGDELPEGTYYYIVDKKNGEKPVSGYLELLR